MFDALKDYGIRQHGAKAELAEITVNGNSFALLLANGKISVIIKGENNNTEYLEYKTPEDLVKDLKEHSEKFGAEKSIQMRRYRL